MSSKSDKSVLVTGGAGYIGSHTAKALARVGFRPVTLDNLVYGHKEAVRWGPFEPGDVGDPGRVRSVLEEYRPAAVIHFAGFAYVGESMSAPGKYYRNNVCGGLTLLEAMRDLGPKPIIFSSSCATYGLPTRLPISETHPQVPISPYGMSKHVFERMLSDFEAAHGIRAVSLRYFNAAGADPEGELGENHDPETHLLPLAIMAALGKRPSFEIYGVDYPTPDGTAIRDYIHVSDLAEAHVLALEHLLAGGEGTALNLGVGRGWSVREVLAEIERVSGRRVPVREGPRRAGDPPELTADAGRALEVLGWRPKHSDLETIVRTACNWFASDMGL